jgi:phosphoribosylformimino-5-aminoimidazole carboxamide ribotide isomerase
VALDADGEQVRFPSGGARLSLLDAAAELAYRGVRDLVYTDLARAGTLSGPNLAALARLCDATEGTVAYGGGVASAADVAALAALPSPPLRAVLIATALDEQRLQLPDALAAAAANRSEEEK